MRVSEYFPLPFQKDEEKNYIHVDSAAPTAEFYFSAMRTAENFLHVIFPY